MKKNKNKKCVNHEVSSRMSSRRKNNKIVLKEKRQHQEFLKDLEKIINESCRYRTYGK